MTLRKSSNRRLRCDDGVTVVFVALALVALVMVSALAIDGGQAYAQRRVSQNAADAASMAGARAIDKLRFENPNPGLSASRLTVYDAVRDTLSSNHTDPDLAQCWIIANDAARTRLSGDFCTNSSVVTNFDFLVKHGSSYAAGVEVEAANEKTVLLASVMGFDNTTARATAAATIQPYLGGQGSPFIICGVPTVNSDAYNILEPAPTGGYQLTSTAKSGSIGTIDLQEAQAKQCGAGSAFKGKNNAQKIVIGVPCSQSSPPFDPPCEKAWADNGNGFDHTIRDTVVGANPCTFDSHGDISNSPCDILTPVASNGNGNGVHIWTKIVGWVLMHVTGDGHGNPKYQGTVVGSGGIVTGGEGGLGDVSGDSLRVIKLAQ